MSVVFVLRLAAASSARLLISMITIFFSPCRFLVVVISVERHSTGTNSQKKKIKRESDRDERKNMFGSNFKVMTLNTTERNDKGYLIACEHVSLSVRLLWPFSFQHLLPCPTPFQYIVILCASTLLLFLPRSLRTLFFFLCHHFWTYLVSILKMLYNKNCMIKIKYTSVVYDTYV